ncbi:MAG: carbohydrate ABC transporter permease [Chloroflexi bacterium AL-W]|nr:carbohydrate ABC transporter permease [Chloroflexi bacterium AL-N1]NOK70063.1 carbohydrate ABC transporter permease [Chloroflexi bacterium AL-N10]NOK77925.1 carbohydrate ABC transporter permease [Chloroflexi bacterium AL-N5]NOK84934.1 carbohydrate ABC transporter permease [Chloroflexi bacterium AL-W]NOK91913.1 carbohydrate ABC transporter permease [Chloroflexi bacterium AL-N15]
MAFRLPRRGGLQSRRFETKERSLLSPLESRKPGARFRYWAMFVVLMLLTLSTIFPLYWMFSGALKTTTEMFRMPPTIMPQDPQWSNYPLAWSRLRYDLYFRNTIGLTLGAWVLQILVSATAAFSLSKLKPAFGNIILFLFLSTLMVPPAAYLIPQYLTVVNVPLLNVRLIDTWWAVWLPGAVSAFSIFILKSFFDEVPVDLTDAAYIDGASAWHMFTRIALPLSKPVLAVVSIFSVIGSWKDFFWPFLVLTNTDLQPIMVALYRLSNRAEEPLNLIVAALAIASIPPLILFVIFQRQIIRGITFTGLKG